MNRSQIIKNMENLQLKTPLSNVQLEILNLFSRDLEETELLEIKRLLVQFLAAKAARLAAKVWEKKGWGDEDMDKLAHAHKRTPYKR